MPTPLTLQPAMISSKLETKSEMTVKFFWKGASKFDNLTSLFLYEGDLMPLPSDLHIELEELNAAIKDRTYTYLSLASNIGFTALGLILDQTFAAAPSYSLGGAVVGIWASEQLKDIRDKKRDEANTEKKALREKVKILYKDMAKDLLRQYIAPDRYKKSNRHIALNIANVDHARILKIKNALINLKIHDLYLDKQVKHKKRDEQIEDILKPLVDATDLIKVLNKRAKPIRWDDHYWQKNSMFDYYLRVGPTHSPSFFQGEMPHSNEGKAFRRQRTVVQPDSLNVMVQQLTNSETSNVEFYPDGVAMDKAASQIESDKSNQAEYDECKESSIAISKTPIPEPENCTDSDQDDGMTRRLQAFNDVSPYQNVFSLFGERGRKTLPEIEVNPPIPQNLGLLSFYSQRTPKLNTGKVADGMNYPIPPALGLSSANED